MKKFKLIKEYPGVVDSLGAIAKQKGEDFYVFHDKNQVERKVSSDYIEKYPEYWQEVEEKKLPLYLSKDGVDIYEGDVIWGIDIKSLEVFSSIASRDIDLQDWKYGRFSSENAAKIYVATITKEYSLMDIRDTLGPQAAVQFLFKYDLEGFLKKLVENED